jgi:hypothetical protein
MCAKKINKICGKGFSPFENKIDVLRDFRYCIVVQNCRRDFYFTEHLIDCLLTGTIPIFWGSLGIEKFFNMNGILTFNTIKDLRKILSQANDVDYANRLDAIQDNLHRAYKYVLAEDYMYIHFLRKIIAGAYPL